MLWAQVIIWIYWIFLFALFTDLPPLQTHFFERNGKAFLIYIFFSLVVHTIFPRRLKSIYARCPGKSYLQPKEF